MAHSLRSGTRRIRRYLAFYAFALAIALTLLAGVLLIVQNHALTSAEIESTIGIELIAAAAFSVIFTTLTAWIETGNSEESFAERIKEITAQILSEVRTEGKLYVPVATFPATDGFDDGYNRAVMESMQHTTRYDFCGPSARYVAARLMLLRHSPQQVRIAMADPKNEAVVTRRAADRKHWLSSKGKSLTELEALFHHELLAATVALFDFRHTCPIQVVYVPDPVVYRYESTDEALFYSWYHSTESSGREMPRAAQFGPHSMYHQVLSQEMSRRFEVMSRKVTFTPAMTEPMLCGFLHELAGEDFEVADLQQYRDDYGKMTLSFTKYLRSLGYLGDPD